MKLTGELKEKVDKAETKEEAKQTIEEAGMFLLLASWYIKNRFQNLWSSIKHSPGHLIQIIIRQFHRGVFLGLGLFVLFFLFHLYALLSTT